MEGVPGDDYQAEFVVEEGDGGAKVLREGEEGGRGGRERREGER